MLKGQGLVSVCCVHVSMASNLSIGEEAQFKHSSHVAHHVQPFAHEGEEPNTNLV